jgi:tRNA (guanine37-N1)-methyltransferase
MHINVISLFPEMVNDAAEYGVVGRALDRELVDLKCTNPRDFTQDAYQTVDDRPYGGGPGMVLKYEPVAAAISSAREKLPEGGKVIFLSPQGRTLNQEIAGELSELPGLVLVAGRYEGLTNGCWKILPTKSCQLATMY